MTMENTKDDHSHCHASSHCGCKYDTSENSYCPVGTGYLCPECQGNLYEDEADGEPSWFECDHCEYQCDSYSERDTGVTYPIYLKDIVEMNHRD